MKSRTVNRKVQGKWRGVWRRCRTCLGPGLITGASDDDPSGIATYSQAGAAFGYQLGWLLIFTYPLMSVIQQISGVIGRVTGKGIAANLRGNFYSPLVYAILALLFIANTINLGADIGAMAAVLKLLVGGPQLAYVAGFGMTCAILQCFVPYGRYVAALKWLTLSLLTYVATLFAVKLSWSELGRALFIPSLTLSRESLTIIVAVLGTTISPYLFFWQANSEVEDSQASPWSAPLKDDPKNGRAEISRINMDTLIGMGLSNFVALCILITAAASLHTQGQTDVHSAEQAAAALRPIAGNFAFVIFSLGIIGTGMLAVLVLAGSASYAIGEVLSWPIGLAKKPHQAKRFYGTIVFITLLGIGLNFTAIEPFKALVWSAVINGVVAVPVMAMMLILARKRSVMGKFALSLPMTVVGWIATGIMGVAVVALIAVGN